MVVKERIPNICIACSVEYKFAEMVKFSRFESHRIEAGAGQASRYRFTQWSEAKYPKSKPKINLIKYVRCKIEALELQHPFYSIL